MMATGETAGPETAWTIAMAPDTGTTTGMTTETITGTTIGMTTAARAIATITIDRFGSP